MDVLGRLIFIPGIVKSTHQPILHMCDPVFLHLMLATKRIAEAPNCRSSLSYLSVSLFSSMALFVTSVLTRAMGCRAGRGVGLFFLDFGWRRGCGAGRGAGIFFLGFGWHKGTCGLFFLDFDREVVPFPFQ